MPIIKNVNEISLLSDICSSQNQNVLSSSCFAKQLFAQIVINVMRICFLLRLCCKYMLLHIFPHKTFVCINHSFVRDSYFAKVCDLFLSCSFFLSFFLSFLLSFLHYSFHCFNLPLYKSAMLWYDMRYTGYFIFLCFPVTDAVSTRMLTKRRLTVLGRFYNVG